MLLFFIIWTEFPICKSFFLAPIIAILPPIHSAVTHLAVQPPSVYNSISNGANKVASPSAPTVRGCLPRSELCSTTGVDADVIPLGGRHLAVEPPRAHRQVL